MNRLPTLRLSSVQFVVVASLFLLSAEPSRSQVFPPASVRQTVLPNGLRLVARQLPGAALVSVSAWVHAGSARETGENNGVAHLLEHYLFQGDLDPAQSFDRLIERRGGVLNAETTRDHTQFYAITPAVNLTDTLAVISKMLAKPRFDPAHLEIERHRVEDEISQHMGDLTTVIEQEMHRIAFQASSYGLPVAGTVASVDRLTLPQIQAFYNANYRPDDVTLVVVGPTAAEDVQKAVTSIFGDWKRPASAPPELPAQRQQQRSTPNQVIPLQGGPGRIAVGFPAPSGAHAKEAATVDVIYTMLTGGEKSLLARKLAVLGFGQDPGGDYVTTRGPGTLIVWADAPAGRLDRLRQAIIGVVNGLGGGAFFDEDLARAKQALIGAYALQNETVNDQGTSLGFYDVASDASAAVQYESMVRSISREDVVLLARKYFAVSYPITLLPR